MRLSVIWLFDDSEDNSKTFSCLHQELAQEENAEVILYANEGAEKKYSELLQGLNYRIYSRGDRSDIECYNDARKHVMGDMVTAISSGDTFSPGSIRAMEKAVGQYKKETVFMLCKIMPDGRDGAFSFG